MTSKVDRKGVVGYLTTAFARETFPPKWLLVVAILAVIAGLSLANYRITAAEASLTEFAGQVEQACADKRPVFENSRAVCADAAENADGPAIPAVPLPPIKGEPGPEGRGIADLECVLMSKGHGLWQVTYTDKTVDSDAGVCYLPPSPK